MSSYDVYRAYLAQVPMFSACSQAELDEVIAAATVRPIADGEDVIVEGNAGQEFFVIGNGSAIVRRQGKKLATLGQGDFFGELALFDPAPRNATVTATTALNLLVLGSDAFATLLERSPTIRGNVLKGMARRLHDLDARA